MITELRARSKRIAELEAEVDMYRDTAEEAHGRERMLEAEVARLRAELEVAQAFHEVAVKERDYERAVVARLKAK